MLQAIPPTLGTAVIVPLRKMDPAETGMLIWTPATQGIPPMFQLYGNILETIGNTPIVKFRLRPQVSIYLSSWRHSIPWSIKDRLAPWRDRRRGAIPLQTVVEATSGNTGIGLAQSGLRM